MTVPARPTARITGSGSRRRAATRPPCSATRRRASPVHRDRRHRDRRPRRGSGRRGRAPTDEMRTSTSARVDAVVGGDVSRDERPAAIGSPFGQSSTSTARRFPRRDRRRVPALGPRRQRRDEHDDREQQQRHRRDPLDRDEPALAPAHVTAPVALRARSVMCQSGTSIGNHDRSETSRRRDDHAPSTVRSAARRRASSDPPATEPHDLVRARLARPRRPAAAARRRVHLRRARRGPRPARRGRRAGSPRARTARASTRSRRRTGSS